MIYIFRHGQTDWNLAGRVQGHKETSLNETGITQAKTLATFFSKLKIEKLYVSPQKRAQQTASYLGVEISSDERLKEISFGDFEGFTIKEIEEQRPDLIEQRNKDRWNFAFKNGESMADVWRRAGSFADEKLKNKSDSEIFGVLAHGALNRVLTGYILNLAPQQILKMMQPNNVFYKIYKKQISYCKYEKYPHWYKGMLER